MDWRWRGLSARPSLQRTSKASTKGAVKEAAMVKLPLLCSELVLQAMKVIFSGRQGKSADGWTNSLAQRSVGTYNWLTQIPRLSQHRGLWDAAHAEKYLSSLKITQQFQWRCPPLFFRWCFCLPSSCKYCILQLADSHAALSHVAVTDITSIDFTL